MNYSNIPPEVLNATITTLDGEKTHLAAFISSTSKETIIDFYHAMVGDVLIGFSFTTNEKKYTLVNTYLGSYFLDSTMS
jgi:hypothetical protein